jgi:hypothetical protein
VRIDVYSTMYNEAQLLPYWLRHYETFASRIFVWLDDDSTDGSREILEQHPLVKILPLDHHKVDDMFWVKGLFQSYKRISRRKAEWVMVADGDEFIYHPDMQAALAQAKNNGVDVITCAGYTVISDRFPETQGQIYDELKMGLPDMWMEKDTVFHPSVRMKWRPGRHGISRIRKSDGTQAIRDKETGVRILHYNYLGREYFQWRYERRIERLGIPNAQFNHGNNQLPDGTRGNQQEWYERNISRAYDVTQ